MTKSVGFALAAFTGLMLIVIGVATGLGERYLEPSGITENVISPQYSDTGRITQRDEIAVSCGSAWSPFDAVPDSYQPAADPPESTLSYLGAVRCTAVLAGVGLTGALITVLGAGIVVILLIGSVGSWVAARRRAEDEKWDRIRTRNRAEGDPDLRARTDPGH